MPYFVGDAYLDGDEITNIDIHDSAITKSTLDMNMERITSVHDPVEMQDAVTMKWANEQLKLAFTTYGVTLTGTDPVVLDDLPMGSYTVTIFPSEIGAPTAMYMIAKTDPSRKGFTNRLGMVSEGDTLIHVEWVEYSPVTLRKSDSRWDGTYRVKVS